MSHELRSGYDAELQRLDAVFRRACEVGVRDRVLDIGCGTGLTTRAAGRAARDGSTLGVDISSSAIDEARRSARLQGPGNVTFECADVQVHDFPREHFDLAISRFGTMFFDDAPAAFSNIASALRPAGRLVIMVWQAAERNEWATGVAQALREPALSDAFSLGEPSATTRILRSAGFVDIGFTDVDEQVWYGPDAEAALAWIGGFASTRAVMSRRDDEGARRGWAALRDLVAAHLRDDGVWFGSRSWIVTARRV